MDTEDDVSFLARSPNRGRVLDSLVEQPRDRAALAAAVGTSQPTLGRVLTALEERGWIRREDDLYAATPVGKLVASAYADFRATLVTARELGDVADLLPTSDGLDPAWLASAEVVRPTRSNPLAVTRRAAEQVRSADHVRVLTHQVAPGNVDVLFERLGEQTLEAVLDEGAVETLAATRTTAEKAAAIADAETASIAVAESVPHVVAITDGQVGMGVPDEEGRPTVLLLSDEPQLVRWAEETFDRYRRTGRPLHAADVDG